MASDNVVVKAAKRRVTAWLIGWLAGWPGIILLLVLGMIGLVIGLMPSANAQPSPLAKSLLPAKMLSFYRSGIVKRECPSLSWTIVAAVVHIESDDGRLPGTGKRNARGALGSAGNPEPPPGLDEVTYTPDGQPREPGFYNPTNPYDTGRHGQTNREKNGGQGSKDEGWDYDKHQWKPGFGPTNPGNVMGQPAEPTYGPSQFTLAEWDAQNKQQVVWFQIPGRPTGPNYPKPDEVTHTPDGTAREPGFLNPDNPYDTGRSGETNREKNGGKGGKVGAWDYDKHRWKPGKPGSLIPFGRLPDGQGYALDGNGDGKADIMNPADAVPALARYLCAKGASTPSGLLNALAVYNPSDWFLLGDADLQQPGTLVLAKQLEGGSSISVGPTANPGFAPGQPAPPGIAATNQQIETAVQVALSAVGTPYVWGGESEAGGFDCSGLVWWAFDQAGIKFPRMTAAGEYNLGTHVDQTQLQRGDLLFWAYDKSNPNTIHHVAIYLGNGMMVAAPHSGAFVQVQPVYWNGFIGGTRLG